MEVMLLQQCCITGPKCHLVPISIPIPDTRYPIPAVDTLSGFPYVITAMLSHWTCHLLPISIAIPDTRCRYLARCSFFQSSICLSGSFSSSSSSLLPRNGSSCCFILCHFWTSEETFRALDESREVPTLEDCGGKKESNMDKKLTIIKQQLWH